VLSIQVLEHVQDIDTYFNESYRLLKKGGILLISTHGFWTYHPHPHDLRRWTLEGLTFEIKRHGFEIMDTYGIMGMLAFGSQLRLNFFEEYLLYKGLIAKVLLASISFMYQLSMIVQDKITPESSFKKNLAVYFVVARKSN
jgi:SAM-dependent methyltransferase